MNKIWRLVFTVLLTVMCAFVGWYFVGTLLNVVTSDSTIGPLFLHNDGALMVVYQAVFVFVSLIFGSALGGAIFRRIEQLGERFKSMSVRDKLALITGLIIGLILSAIVSLPIIAVIANKIVAVAASLAVGLTLTYLSTAATLSMKEEMGVYIPQPPDDTPPKEAVKILDTNVIIDGRVADIVRSGFLEGTIYVPGFVLDELQHIADSADNLRRARGRRGLDTLNQMDKESKLKMVVRAYDRFAPGSGEVDGRLVQMAKTLNASLVTNDWNLNKVAELQGVPVLNINDLANALKPVVLPGEEMQVLVVKEGKESSQGVGYLDDGTMIVVEGGRRHLGDTVEVIVSSVLQTSAGKMIFAHLRDEEGDDFDRSVRSYTGGGPRRPVRRPPKQDF